MNNERSSRATEKIPQQRRQQDALAEIEPFPYSSGGPRVREGGFYRPRDSPGRGAGERASNRESSYRRGGNTLFQAASASELWSTLYT